jgi:hypothetical protein
LVREVAFSRSRRRGGRGFRVCSRREPRSRTVRGRERTHKRVGAKGQRRVRRPPVVARTRLPIRRKFSRTRLSSRASRATSPTGPGDAGLHTATSFRSSTSARATRRERTEMYVVLSSDADLETIHELYDAPTSRRRSSSSESCFSSQCSSTSFVRRARRGGLASSDPPAWRIVRSNQIRQSRMESFDERSCLQDHSTDRFLGHWSDDAVKRAIEKASATIRNLRWFEVIETRRPHRGRASTLTGS